ncbi:uncharacterized protein PHALS_10504 [Plasmopara halstedii]|uniref:Uncharacterized protein n=1 Tax=Plasmopara halstedii TaxID=4781 RepID=A0A0P1AGP3_PLAHL|nr:uncharacterized protein PHALS_10504 [Plasmopara halstedii]CEG40296.1 hypothetical protein PHALS_10504 [Plasmopara halstedii]|eukprot:XP_024576665.1 hypothetical protein PHALS_10504 [Plasmopara halstedii]
MPQSEFCERTAGSHCKASCVKRPVLQASFEQESTFVRKRRVFRGKIGQCAVWHFTKHKISRELISMNRLTNDTDTREKAERITPNYLMDPVNKFPTSTQTKSTLRSCPHEWNG